MIVTCPQCSRRYLLPPRLVGSAGARIRCPGCGRRFDVDALGALVATAALAASAASASSGEARAASGDVVPLASGTRLSALDRVRALDRPPGVLARAGARGRLFAEFGPALLDAFDEHRRGRDPQSSAAEFREAIRVVAGVELTARSSG